MLAELCIRGFNVDVGVVPVRILDENGKQVRQTYEVDFVANKGSQRYYVQSAWKLQDKEKEDQEVRPFRSISDSFKKIVVTGDNVLLKRDENGIVTIPVEQFLNDPDSLRLRPSSTSSCSARRTPTPSSSMLTKL